MRALWDDGPGLRLRGAAAARDAGGGSDLFAGGGIKPLAVYHHTREGYREAAQ